MSIRSKRTNKFWEYVDIPVDVMEIIQEAPTLHVPEKREDLLNWALGRMADETDWSYGNREDSGQYEVAFQVEGRGRVVEAVVNKTRNGLSVNYLEAGMRRRDPGAMVIGDEFPTDKDRFKDRFNQDFVPVRQQMLDWLKKQNLIIMPFYAGPADLKIGSLLICPRAAGFFAGGLADLQGMIPGSDVPKDFKLNGGVLFIVPPFRHTHFSGKQVVVHNRLEGYQELFSNNLYPGPSAKKGVYSILLHLGEKEGWVTNHCSTVMVETPYDNHVTIMHEGASGGGKSEMLEHIHRTDDGRLVLGTNVLTGKERLIVLPEACHLYPMMDDMGAAHSDYQTGKKQLQVADAEDGWFLRVDHIEHYGTDPHLERLAIEPPEPLIFLNHHAMPGGLALIWEHTEDAPGKACPNPRLIIPRRLVDNVKAGPTGVHVRSFGVRCPPTHADSPLYGILGIFHVLQPALAWLWRLVAPRGFANPSIHDEGGMGSEGVGSYWAFCTGRRVDQANLLLKQILASPATRYVLIPNQHVGAWKVGFMAEWLTREYLARRGGARFRDGQLQDARCSLLGEIPVQVQIEGSRVPERFIDTRLQSEVGNKVYDNGARLLQEFFEKELKLFADHPDLDPLGKKIIDCCFGHGKTDDYRKLIDHGQDEDY